jgi:hypothetical protein
MHTLTSENALNDPRIISECDVIIGKDNYLFLYQGGHKVYDFASGKRTPDPLSIQIYRSNIASRSSYMYQNGIKYVHLAMPDKQTALANHYILNNPYSLNHRFLKNQENTKFFSYINLTDYIVSLGASAWLKGDTHLHGTASYNISAYVERMLREATGEEIDKDKIFDDASIDGYVGDLSSKLVKTPHSFSETKKYMRRLWIEAFYQNSIPGGNNGLVDIHVCKHDKQKKPRLLFFGDSFGREIAWYLSRFYSVTMFCRTPFVHYEIVSAYKPDIVISQGIERYLPRTEPDINAPNFLLYSRIGRHFGKENGDMAFFHALNNCLCGIVPNLN